MMGLALLLLLDVAAGQHCASRAPSTARLFSYEDLGSYQIVNSTQCNERYVLYPRADTPPNLGSGFKYFGVPLQNVAVTQTVTNTFLELLGQRSKMIVASPYSTSACIHTRVVDGSSEAFVRSSSNATAHGLQMSNSALDAIFSDPYYTSSWSHAASASKVICEASTYETTPLGSAEWVKFFGYLFGTSTEAEAVFCGTSSRYACNSLVANNLNIGSTRVPKVLFTSYSSYSGAHQIQMPPYKDVFVNDAGAVYPDLTAIAGRLQMHWTGTQVSSMTFPQSNISEFHAALALADVIIDETYPHGQTMDSIKTAYALPNLTVGQTFMAGGDDPGSGSTGWSLVSHGVGGKLFTVDSTGLVVPQLATSVARQSGGTWLLTLASGIFFSDGSAVTAADVKASIERTNGLNSAAQSSVGTITMTVLTTTTISISTTIATPVMASVLAEWWAVVYKTSAAGGRIFTGPYAIQHHDTTSTINELYLAPNAYYPGASQRMPINIRQYASGDAVVAALQSGEIDMGFNLPQNSVSQLSWVEGASVKSIPVDYQYMMFMNTTSAKLSDVRVRKAISLAIDRSALANAISPPGLAASTVAQAVATGAFNARSAWGAAHPPMPTNLTESARLLDEAGWVVNTGNNNMREKAGVQLTLDLVYYTFRSDLVTMAPLVQSQLAALGITATPRVNDNGDFMVGQGFDMLMWAQNTLPAGDPNWFLETFFRSGPVNTGSWSAQNFAQLSSASIDSALDVLGSAEGAARVTATANAHDLILDQVPATFLTSPIWHVGLSSRVSSYEPWGSDYYVIKEQMPASDWPPAIVNGRVYQLDGTMDSRGPPYGGTDWYESRVAEPDGFLSDLIAVAHPTGTNYAPSGMRFLRHVPTGTTHSTQASECTNPSAARPALAATCQALASTNGGLATQLNSADGAGFTPNIGVGTTGGSSAGTTGGGPAAPPSSSSSDDDDDTALYGFTCGSAFSPSRRSPLLPSLLGS